MNVDDQFGTTLSLSDDGKTLAVGVRGFDPLDKEKAGQARVFKYIDSKWQPMVTIDGIIKNSNLSCVSLSHDGKTLAVGATGFEFLLEGNPDDPNPDINEESYVRVYKYLDSDSDFINGI